MYMNQYDERIRIDRVPVVMEKRERPSTYLIEEDSILYPIKRDIVMKRTIDRSL